MFFLLTTTKGLQVNKIQRAGLHFRIIESLSRPEYLMLRCLHPEIQPRYQKICFGTCISGFKYGVIFGYPFFKFHGVPTSVYFNENIRTHKFLDLFGDCLLSTIFTCIFFSWLLLIIQSFHCIILSGL